jgi:hypothetical protein
MWTGRLIPVSSVGALQGLSTLAHITLTSFVNACHWDNFRGDPRALVERYFDVLTDGDPTAAGPTARCDFSRYTPIIPSRTSITEGSGVDRSSEA